MKSNIINVVHTKIFRPNIPILTRYRYDLSSNDLSYFLAFKNGHQYNNTIINSLRIIKNDLNMPLTHAVIKSDARVLITNYKYKDLPFTLQIEYESDDPYTQFNYINNLRNTMN